MTTLSISLALRELALADLEGERTAKRSAKRRIVGRYGPSPDARWS